MRYLGRGVVVVHHFPGEGSYRLEVVGIHVHQDDLAVVQFLEREDIHERLGPELTARTDKDDLQHSRLLD